MATHQTIRSRRVVLPEGMRPASIRVRDGVIEEIGDWGALCDDDFGDLAIMPGLVDTHVHINEPGRTSWEGFRSATRAAAAGGITTLIEMPLNSIPATTSAAALELKIACATDQSWVDIGFWGGAVRGNLGELARLYDSGCFGFKCFLTPSGVDEFAHVEANELPAIMGELARLGAVLMAHAELPEFLNDAPRTGRRSYAEYLKSRPRAAENQAIELLLRVSEKTGCHVHIVHLSSAEALAPLRAARARGVPVTVETAPHYLSLHAEEIPEGATEFKCAPPIREAANREALWQGLREGLIDMIVTDHSPCPPEMKERESGDFFSSWGGVASLQLSLPVVWKEASARGFRVDSIARWMSSAPSALAGLTGRKGAIAPGCDADLVVWNPEEEFTVDAKTLLHRHPLTPYDGRRLLGVVKRTYLRGKVVSVAGRPAGAVMRREEAWRLSRAV